MVNKKSGETEREAKALAEAKESVSKKGPSDKQGKPKMETVKSYHGKHLTFVYKRAKKDVKKEKYSNTKKGMNWWNFNIKNMTVGERYLFIALILIIPTMLCFFIGLLIDYLLLQEATYAFWGMGIGAVIAIGTTWVQLKKLVD